LNGRDVIKRHHSPWLALLHPAEKQSKKETRAGESSNSTPRNNLAIARLLGGGALLFLSTAAANATITFMMGSMYRLATGHQWRDRQ
jgi:hypothetical protein